MKNLCLLSATRDKKKNKKYNFNMSSPFNIYTELAIIKSLIKNKKILQ